MYKALNTGPFGVNTWIVPLEQKKVFVIDPASCAFTHDQNKITDYLSQNNLEPLAIILTHGHFDHITGTAILKDLYPDIPLICHKEDAFMIGSCASSVQGSSLSYMGLEALNKALVGLPEADIVLEGDGELTVALSGAETCKVDSTYFDGWTFLHTPGHTKGSMCLYNKEKGVLFSGDTIFYHSYGRTDLEGGSQSQMNDTLKRLYSTLPKETLVFPGHDYYGFELGENFTL